MRGEISIAQEHRASYETLDALAKLQSEILMKLPTGHSILFACLDEEVHEIGLRCAAYLFEAEGWQTHYLVPARRRFICEAMARSPSRRGGNLRDNSSCAGRPFASALPGGRRGTQCWHTLLIGGSGVPAACARRRGMMASWIRDEPC